MILVLDIDNTLADISHRVSILTSSDTITKELFKKFLNKDLVRKDEPFSDAQRVLPKLIKKADEVHIITSRQLVLEKVTRNWLDEHYNLPDNYILHMRKTGDWGESRPHKEKLLNKHILTDKNKDELIMFFDDDPYVLNLYSKYGIAFKAPECWGLMLHYKPRKEERMFTA